MAKPGYAQKAVAAVSFMTLGFLWLQVSTAATNTFSPEAESGVVAGTSAVIDNAAASGGAFVRFGNSAGTGDVYYLSPDGSNINSGTSSAAAWQTLAYALPKLRCGDRLLVSGTHATPFVPAGSVPALAYTASSAQSCTGAERIVVAATPGADPLLKGLHSFRNLQNWTFDNIDVTWHSGAYTDHMLKLQGGRGWIWTNSEIWGANSFANILVARNGTDNPYDWMLSGNCVHDNIASNDPDPENNRSHLVYVGALHGSTGGRITRNIMYRAIAGQGVKLDDGSADQSPTGVAVSYNTVYDVSQNLVLVSDLAADNTFENNLLVKGRDVIRAYGLPTASAGTNSYKNTGYWDASPLVRHYPDTGGRMADQGGHTNADPQFDSTGSCDGFHPQNPAMQKYGRWAP